MSIRPMARRPSHLLLFPSRQWSQHRALDVAEIRFIVEDYRKAAERAKTAGFDGVELHAANGYLPDQFLQDGSNRRTDAYGGSIENRSRFLIEIVEALASVWGGDRIVIRIGPGGTFNGMSDSNPEALFNYLAKELNRFGRAYLHISTSLNRESKATCSSKKVWTRSRRRSYALFSNGKLWQQGVSNPILPRRSSREGMLIWSRSDASSSRIRVTEADTASNPASRLRPADFLHFRLPRLH
jgi:2,4-dienoyl-CoA reductase-like NADH-dependent reductase (Old Yellow Enzyme family)